MPDQREEAVTVAAVGDIMFDRRMRPPRVFYHLPGAATCMPGVRSAPPIPFVNDGASREWLMRQGVYIDDVYKTSHATQSVMLDLPPDATDFDFPFLKIRSELMRADVVFGNLECPLSGRGRPVRSDCCYSASPKYARPMAASNFKVVSFSNNHCMDFGEPAFFDTLDVLQRNGIRVVGAGRNYEDARKPVLFELNGLRLAFLAYNLFGPDTVFATAEESGVVPLNELVVKEDVERARDDADFIFASTHWGVEGEPKPSAWLVGFAHRLIDYGIDVIFGHHAHLPGSIEVYKSKPIFYSLGNFIFGHTHRYWTDNILAKLTLARNRVRKIELTAVGSKGVEQYQPVALSGARAVNVLTFVRQVSEPLGTSIVIEEEKGIVNLESAKAAEVA